MSGKSGSYPLSGIDKTQLQIAHAPHEIKDEMGKCGYRMDCL